MCEIRNSVRNLLSKILTSSSSVDVVRVINFSKNFEVSKNLVPINAPIFQETRSLNQRIKII